MKRTLCTSPIPSATLLCYWLGELDEAGEGRLDEHLLGCDSCSASLQGLLDLAGAVRAAMNSGVLQIVLPEVFLKRLAAEGLRVREYAVAHNGSVHCTVAPEDDLLVARISVPLAGVDRLDIEQKSSTRAQVERLHDVPFDARSGELILANRMKQVRALPESTLRVRLYAVEPAGERLVGEYMFHHSPWRGES